MKIVNTQDNSINQKIENEQIKKGAFFVGNNQNTLFSPKVDDEQKNSITNIKVKANKEAIKTILDAANKEDAPSQTIREFRQETSELKEEADNANTQANIYEEQIKALKKEYQGDLQNEEYLERMNRLTEARDMYLNQAKEAQNEIGGLGRGANAIKNEKLKHHIMSDAYKQEDMINAAAGDEVMGTIMQESMDKIDDEIKEQEEKQEKKEEKEEQQEKIKEAIKEQQPEAEIDKNGNVNNTASNSEETNQTSGEEYRKDTQKTLNQMIDVEIKKAMKDGLTQEDLLGIKVDELL